MATLRSTSTVAPTGMSNPRDDSPVIAAPTGLATGDLLVVAVFFAQAIAAGNVADTPSGMTRLTAQGESPARLGAVFAAVVEDPADFAAGVILSGNADSTRVAAVAAAFEPSTDHFFDITEIVAAGPEWQGSGHTSDTFPAGLTGDLVLGFAMTNKSASTTYTEHTAVGGTLLDQARSLAGASGSVSDSVTSITQGGTGVTYNITQPNGLTFGIGVTEVADAPDPTPDLPVVTGNGFVSVQQMLETPGATWAHRNLGLTYPEMTEYGVRSAANLGYGVIEISCQRTSDGGWIGAHDQTPNRVAVETTHDGTPFSSLTTAQVLAMHIDVGDDGAPQPFATLQQLVETLPSDFVFLIDPKQAGGTTAYMNEFLDEVDSLLGTTRAIIKIDGAATKGRFDLVKARGYLTAAYYYAAPATPTPPSTIASNIVSVDLPGLNYDAAQQGWDDLLAYGKPMWGHVAPNQAAADEAMSKGATFVQCTSASITAVGVDAWIPPAAELTATTSLVRTGSATLTVPVVPPATLTATTALTRTGAASVTAPSIPPTTLTATTSLARGGSAVVFAPDVPMVYLTASTGLSRAGAAVITTPGVEPAELTATTGRVLGGMATIIAPTIPPALITATVGIVRTGIAYLTNGGGEDVDLDDARGPYRRATPLDRLEIHR